MDFGNVPFRFRDTIHACSRNPYHPGDMAPSAASPADACEYAFATNADCPSKRDGGRVGASCERVERVLDW